jgi:4-hydroxybenzoate polyprenyltransferase
VKRALDRGLNRMRRVFGPKAIVIWCVFWAVYDFLTMQGLWRWLAPALMLGTAAGLLLIRRYSDRQLHRQAEAILRYEVARKVFIALLVDKGVPVVVSHRVEELIAAGRPDLATGLVMEWLDKND